MIEPRDPIELDHEACEAWWCPARPGALFALGVVVIGCLMLAVFVIANLP